jgi:hypothetical protein
MTASTGEHVADREQHSRQLVAGKRRPQRRICGIITTGHHLDIDQSEEHLLDVVGWTESSSAWGVLDGQVDVPPASTAGGRSGSPRP